MKKSTTPKTKGRAGGAKTPAKRNDDPAARSTTAKTAAAASRPQTKPATKAKPGAQKRTSAKSSGRDKPHRASAAKPQTKPARGPMPSAGDGQEPAIRKTRSGKEIVDAMAEETGQPQTIVRSVLENLGRQVRRHLRPRGSGRVTIPELHVSLRRVAKPATKSRQGYNPATREAITVAAKPARIVVQARVLKRFREQIGAERS